MKLTNNTLVEIDKNYFIMYYIHSDSKEDMFSFELHKVFKEDGLNISPFKSYTRTQVVKWVGSNTVIILDSLNACFREHERNKLK